MNRKRAGIACLGLSGVFYVPMFLVPLLDAPTATKVALGGGLYALSYVAMFAGIGLMGRDAYAALKERALRRIRRRGGPVSGPPA